MPVPLSSQTIELVEATAPLVAGHVDEIVASLYRRLLSDAEIRRLFNMAHQEGASPQHKALGTALVAYAGHIRNPGVLAEALERIAQKHAGLQILPEHYPHVADAFLGAVFEVLGNAVSPEARVAWKHAYWFLAETLIEREEAIYQSAEKAEGGWRGWRRFEIAERHAETAEITSFILRPVDGGPVLAHRPGQYLSFRFQPGDGEEYRRNYSISSAANGTTYRITVKREPGGRISNWLHDEAVIGTAFDVAPPAGDFFLDPADKREVVLISGGVGLTPMISMLESYGGADLRMVYVHAARDRAHHAMRDHAQKLAHECHVFYNSDGETAVPPKRLQPDLLTRIANPATADYFICGPTGFMAAMIEGLEAANVPKERIHYEFFGPAAA